MTTKHGADVARRSAPRRRGLTETKGIKDGGDGAVRRFGACNVFDSEGIVRYHVERLDDG